MATVQLNLNGLNRKRKQAGILDDKDLAQRMGINPATVHRVLNGKAEPGNRFIAGMALVFGRDSFPKIFNIEVTK